MPPKAQPLTGAQKRYLRSLAHSLDPVVQIGKSGLTPRVLAQIDEALTTHELIKVKLGKETPAETDAVGAEAEKHLGATVAQIIGKIVVLYRRHPEKPRITIPKPGAKTKTNQGKPTPARSKDSDATSSWLRETSNDDDDDDFEDDDE